MAPTGRPIAAVSKAISWPRFTVFQTSRWRAVDAPKTKVREMSEK